MAGAVPGSIRTRSFLISRVATEDDMTMPELAAELAGHGTMVALWSISRRLIRKPLSFKEALLASEQERGAVSAAPESWTHKGQPRVRLEHTGSSSSAKPAQP